MIPSIINNWEERKHIIASWFDQTEHLYYEDIVKKLTEVVLQDIQAGERGKKSYKKVMVIDHGHYQGDMGFLIVPDEYQPSICDYIITNQYYGSCNGCDLLLSITDRCGDKEKRTKDLMTLALHLVQRMKFIGAFEDNG